MDMFSFEYLLVTLCMLFVASVFFSSPSAGSRKPLESRRKSGQNAESSRPKKVPWYRIVEATNETYLIVGGCGFVGRRLIRVLRLRGEKHIKVLDRNKAAFERLEAEDAEAITQIYGDVTNVADIEKACVGVDVVFAPFAIIRYMDRLSWQYKLSYDINVVGTRNLVNACLKAGVKRLIQTSTCAIFSIKYPGALHVNMDDNSPKCTENNATSHYALSKKLAEDIVLNANGSNGRLATGSIRPCCSIIGYGDELTLGRMIRSRQVPLLNPKFVQDFTPVDSIIFAHLLLEGKLRNGPHAEAAGEGFCISNDDPWSVEDFGDVLHDIDNSIKVLPSSLYHSILPPDLLILTPPSVMNAITSYAFKPEKARRILGYHPVMSTEQCIRQSIQEYNEERMIFS